MRPEAGEGFRGYWDCLWCLEGRNSTGMPLGFAIFFEVKVGRYIDEWIDQARRNIKLIRNVKGLYRRGLLTHVYTIIVAYKGRRLLEKLTEADTSYRKNLVAPPLAAPPHRKGETEGAFNAFLVAPSRGLPPLD